MNNNAYFGVTGGTGALSEYESRRGSMRLTATTENGVPVEIGSTELAERFIG